MKLHLRLIVLSLWPFAFLSLPPAGASPGDPKRSIADWTPPKRTRIDALQRLGGAPEARSVSRAGTEPVVLAPRHAQALAVDPKLAQDVMAPHPAHRWTVELTLDDGGSGVLQIRKQGLGIAANVVIEGPPTQAAAERVAKALTARWFKAPDLLTLRHDGAVAMRYPGGRTETLTPLGIRVSPSTSRREPPAPASRHVAQR